MQSKLSPRSRRHLSGPAQKLKIAARETGGTSAQRAPRNAGYAVFSNSSRPISMRRISLVPAPIS